MKKYEEPQMKLHELKSGQIMAASLGRADTKTTAVPEKQDLEDFETTTVSW
jgi:hypothetical protein